MAAGPRVANSARGQSIRKHTLTHSLKPRSTPSRLEPLPQLTHSPGSATLSLTVGRPPRHHHNYHPTFATTHPLSNIDRVLLPSPPLIQIHHHHLRAYIPRPPFAVVHARLILRDPQLTPSSPPFAISRKYHLLERFRLASAFSFLTI